jgi:hypothetical protein
MTVYNIKYSLVTFKCICDTIKWLQSYIWNDMKDAK